MGLGDARRRLAVAEASEQRPHHEERGTQRSHLLGVGDGLGERPRLDAHDVAIDVDTRAEVTQHSRHLADVGDGGDVAQCDGLRR
ncbi:hypothetical protein D3C83_116380 [compost metagenome]